MKMLNFEYQGKSYILVLMVKPLDSLIKDFMAQDSIDANGAEHDEKGRFTGNGGGTHSEEIVLSGTELGGKNLEPFVLRNKAKDIIELIWLVLKLRILNWEKLNFLQMDLRNQFLLVQILENSSFFLH